MSHAGLRAPKQDDQQGMNSPHRSWFRVRYLLAFWLFVLSGVAFLDRTNIAIAGLQMSREYGLGDQKLGGIFKIGRAHV